MTCLGAAVQIAAIAKFNHLTVLTADAHFNNISDLRKENRLIWRQTQCSPHSKIS
jgi:hypothetical protein